MTKDLTPEALSDVLDGAVIDRDPGDEERAYAVAWSRVQAAMDEDEAEADDSTGRRLAIIGDREVAARRRRRITRSASIALVVALAGSGTAAAAAFLATRTGIYATGWDALAGGTGEKLNMAGSDRTEVFEAATADIPFPQGYGEQRNWIIEGQFAYESDVLMAEGNLRSLVANYATCTWADSWVAADDRDDTAGKAVAAAGLATAASSKDIVDNDFYPSTTLESGETVSYYFWVRRLADAAAADDRAALLDVVAHSGSCPYEVVPVIDASSDYLYAGVR